MNIKLLSTISMIAMLAACGSSNNSSSDTPAETVTPEDTYGPTGVVAFNSTTNSFTLDDYVIVADAEARQAADGSTYTQANQNQTGTINTSTIGIQHGSFTAATIEIDTSPTDAIDDYDGYDRVVGMDATFSAPTTSTGLVTYEGQYIVTAGAGNNINDGSIDINVDFEAGTLSGVDGSYSIEGNIDGTEFTGTTTFREGESLMAGGFYDGDYLGGVSGFTDGSNHTSVFIGVAQ